MMGNWAKGIHERVWGKLAWRMQQKSKSPCLKNSGHQGLILEVVPFLHIYAMVYVQSHMKMCFFCVCVCVYTER